MGSNRHRRSDPLTKKDPMPHNHDFDELPGYMRAMGFVLGPDWRAPNTPEVAEQIRKFAGENLSPETIDVAVQMMPQLAAILDQMKFLKPSPTAVQVRFKDVKIGQIFIDESHVEFIKRNNSDDWDNCHLTEWDFSPSGKAHPDELVWVEDSEEVIP